MTGGRGRDDAPGTWKLLKWGKVNNMIRLTKLNREPFLLNHMQIETIEMIPETKIIMMNHDYYIVRETPEAVVRQIENYTAKVRDIYREITISDKRGDLI